MDDRVKLIYYKMLRVDINHIPSGVYRLYAELWLSNGMLYMSPEDVAERMARRLMDD